MSANENNNNFILLAVETSGIQDYIFGSNRLKENIGASYLVKQATEDWAFEALKKVAPENNVDTITNWNVVEYKLNYKQFTTGKLDVLDAEVIYAGGGNFIALFRRPSIAKDFTRQLSKKVLETAPGLTLHIYQEVFEWTGTGLGKAIKSLKENMKRARGTKKASAPVLGLGVTVMCQSTAMPAVETVNDPEERYVSAEIAAKIEAAKYEANKWLDRQLPPAEYENDKPKPDKNYHYPLDFDNMGRSEGENSYIAIVHADGNNMGDIIKGYSDIEDNRDYIEAMRQFSDSVKIISTTAMMAVIQQIRDSVDLKTQSIKGSNSVGTVKLEPIDKKNLGKGYYLPIRPIVFGGDDTTFVCDGRVALDLTITYLKEFEKTSEEVLKNLKQTNQKPLKKISACAGISIVKTHYPFARAYNLAEELCGEAKKFRRRYFPEGGGALDWYFTAGGLYSDLEKMREREYFVEGVGDLTLRPVSLEEVKDTHGNRKEGVISWGDIKGITQDFESGEEWAGRRNKVKALRDALREGPPEVERFLNIYRKDDNKPSKLPPFGTSEQFPTEGWDNGKCGYFDALELLDIYLPLDKEQPKNDSTVSN